MRLPGIRAALRDQLRCANRPHPPLARLRLPAAIAFGTATLLEIAAYYIPWFDHLLDTIATPAAVVAGMVASASVMVDLPPVLKWGVALIGGGGAAGLLQGATVLLRLKSLAATGGAATEADRTAAETGDGPGPNSKMSDCGSENCGSGRGIGKLFYCESWRQADSISARAAAASGWSGMRGTPP